MAELVANSGDPDQMPHSVASDLSLLSLLITLTTTVWYENCFMKEYDNMVKKKKKKKLRRQKFFYKIVHAPDWLMFSYQANLVGYRNIPKYWDT